MPAWDSMKEKYGDDNLFYIIKKWENNDKSINNLMDLLEYVEESNYDLGTNDDDNSYVDIFSTSVDGIPEFIYNEAKEYGFEEALPNFNVKEVYLKMEKPLITNDPEKAKNALKNGYDSVIYNGTGTVDDTTEYIVYKPTQIKSVDNNGSYDPDNPDIFK